jgi:hypothetical protein
MTRTALAMLLAPMPSEDVCSRKRLDVKLQASTKFEEAPARGRPLDDSSLLPSGGKFHLDHRPGVSALEKS